MSNFAVVLGASTGVGASIAKHLGVLAGMNVIGFHRGKHQAEANAVADRIRETGPRCDMFALDVGSSAEAVGSGLASIRNLLGEGAVRVFVHSLAGASVGNIMEQSEANVERTFNCLAHSFLYWCQGLDSMKLLAANARIIALSNPCADYYLTGTAAIGAAKAALETYVKTLAVVLGPKGYRVNCVRFVTVLTPALRKTMPPAVLEKFEAIHARIVPAGRAQQARDVANFVTYLVTRDTWANGAIIDYTGGLTSTLIDVAFNG
jgi:3-oxoacyl-[acyl-carrier protein] reductase